MAVADREAYRNIRQRYIRKRNNHSFLSCDFNWISYFDRGDYLKKIRVAVCDTDRVYRERLAEYLIRKKSRQIQVYAFSGKRMLMDQLKSQPVDIVLYGTGFEPVPSAGESLFIRMTEEQSGEEGAIFKYQSAEEILRQMYAYYLRQRQKNLGSSRKAKEIAAIYSPTHCMMQTPFALAMSNTLSMEKQFIYLHMGEWFTFCNYMC